MKRRTTAMRVSDHAVLRFLERECDLDVEAVRAHLTTLGNDAAALGAIAVQVGKVKLVLAEAAVDANGTRDVVMTTVLPRRRIVNRWSLRDER